MKKEKKNSKNKGKRRENEEGRMSRFWGIAWVMPVFILILIVLASLLVSGLTTEEKNTLQNELDSLENELANNGYRWLINLIDINGGEI